MGFTGAHVLYTFDVFILALYLLFHGCALLKYTCNQNLIYLRHLSSCFTVKGSNTCFWGSHSWVQTADALYWSNLTSVWLFLLMGYIGRELCVFPDRIFPGSYISISGLKIVSLTVHLQQPLVCPSSSLYLPTLGLSDDDYQFRVINATMRTHLVS